MHRLTKTTSFFMIAVGIIFLFYAWLPVTPNEASPSVKLTTAHPLEGTWKLLAARWNADTKQFADNTIYKIYTGNRFAFIFYNEKTNTFSGGGGGTYTVNGNQFTEHLEYFSFDTTAVGSSQTFQFEIKDGIFHQTGTLNTEKYPDYAIHEFYERVEPGISTLTDKHPLVGVWNIEEASYGGRKSDIAGRYGKVIKIFTPGYFYGVFFNPDTGYFNGITFGTWQTESKDTYSETIKAYSWDSSAVGKPMTFNWRVDNDTFYQTGKINSDRYQDYEIREVSSRME